MFVFTVIIMLTMENEKVSLGLMHIIIFNLYSTHRKPGIPCPFYNRGNEAQEDTVIF